MEDDFNTAKKKKFAESNGISDSLLDAVKSIVYKEAEEKLDETLKPTKVFNRKEFNKELKSYNAKTREILKSAKKEKAASAKKEPEVNKEEVDLSADELARLDSIAKKFD